MSEKLDFRTPFNSQHVKGSQTLLKSARQQFYRLLSSLRRKWSWKISLLLIFKVLGLFLCTLSADDKYSLPNSENLRQPIQMYFSQNPKNFSRSFYSISKIYIKSWIFLKKRWCSYLQTGKNVVRKMSNKTRFRTPFDSQHPQGLQQLLKSVGQHFYHTLPLF